MLADGGSLAVLTTVPDWSGTSWVRRWAACWPNCARPTLTSRDPPWQQVLRDSGRFEEPRELRITWWREATPERMVAHVGSMSWIAALEEPQRAATLSRVAALIEGGTTPELMPAHVILGLGALKR